MVKVRVNEEMYQALQRVPDEDWFAAAGLNIKRMTMVALVRRQLVEVKAEPERPEILLVKRVPHALENVTVIVPRARANADDVQAAPAPAKTSNAVEANGEEGDDDEFCYPDPPVG